MLCFPLGEMNLIRNHFAWIVLYDTALSSAKRRGRKRRHCVSHFWGTQCPQVSQTQYWKQRVQAFTLMTIPDTMDSWTPYFNHYAFWNLELVINVSIFRWRPLFPLFVIVSQFVVEFVLVNENSVMFQSCVVFP